MFKAVIGESVSNGTSKMWCNDGFIETITFEKMAAVFGERECHYWEPERGYDCGAFYFTPEDQPEMVIGIGFRWGYPRLRANYITDEIQSAFLTWLKGQL